MKHLTACLLVAGLVISLAPCASADYEILLKNGGRFITAQYWQEKNEIRFYYLGGVVGIEKSAVAGVKQLTTNYAEAELREKATAAMTPAVKTKEARAGDAKSGAAGGADAAASPPAKGAAPEPPKAADPYLPRFQEMSSRSLGIPTMTTAELYAFSDDVTALKKEVLTKGFAHRYPDQLTDLYAVGDRIEQAIKNKSQ